MKSYSDVFSVSKEKSDQIVDAALETILGTGVTSGSGYYTLNSFDLQGEKLNLVFEVCRLETEDDRRVYAVYYAVEYDGGDNLFCEWNETEHLSKDELKQLVYEIGNTDYSNEILKLMFAKEKTVMPEKGEEPVDNSTNIANCEWIIEQAKMLKALFECSSENMIVANKTRASAAIKTISASLDELKTYVENIDRKNPLDRIIADCEKMSDSTKDKITINKNKENVL